MTLQGTLTTACWEQLDCSRQLTHPNEHMLISISVCSTSICSIGVWLKSQHLIGAEASPCAEGALVSLEIHPKIAPKKKSPTLRELRIAVSRCDALLVTRNCHLVVHVAHHLELQIDGDLHLGVEFIGLRFVGCHVRCLFEWPANRIGRGPLEFSGVSSQNGVSSRSRTVAGEVVR